MSESPHPPSTANVTNKQDTDLQRRLATDAPSRSRFAPNTAVPGLSSWLLEHRLGGGGFGEVWLARHAWNPKEKPRAVKFCTDPDARHRLVTHERNVVLRVMKYAGDHPNVVPLLECNLDGETPWLMYEFVEGGTLAGAVEQWGELSRTERLTRAALTLHALAGALGRFHRLDPPIVHRDLKPQNILMAGSVPRITDFGIGGVALQPGADGVADERTANAARVPTALHAHGTRLYAPPEQMLGAAPHPRDDVYALGVIAYQMMLGDLKAAPGPDAVDELREQGVSDGFCSLIVKSVALNPDRRPKDGGEWETAVAGWLPRESPAGSPTKLPAAVATVGGQQPTWRVTVPGIWYSRPEGDASASWQQVTKTPAEVSHQRGEEYYLHLMWYATEAELAGLAHLRGLTALHTLVLHGRLADASISHLGHLTALRRVDWSGCAHLTDAGVAHLKSMTALQALDLGGCAQITDAGVGHLKEMTTLQDLSLSGCTGVTDAGVGLLKTLTALQTLSLSGCERITNAGISHLKSLPALQTLSLLGCKRLTSAGIASLKTALPNCRIDY